MLRNTRLGYGVMIRALHWIMALLLIGLFALGWYMTEIDYYNPWYKTSFDLHKSFGVLALLLFIVRIGWVLIDVHPDYPVGMPAWERVAAGVVHWSLYLLMLALPITGYLISTANGDGVMVFDLFEIPALLPAADGREELAGRIHYLLGFGGAWLVLGHVAAALKHHFIEGDDILLRMLLGRQ